MAKSRIPLLVLEENRLPFSAIERLHRREGWTGTELLYLYGAAGDGKSMLVKHFLHLEKKELGKQRYEQVTAAEFSADFTEAVTLEQIDQFQERFHSLDLLICEDVGAIDTRKEAQRQLILAIDAVGQRNGRVLLTANRSPGSLTGYPARFVNRCHGGLCVGIKPLKPTSRVKMITHLSSCQQILLPQEQIQKLAATVKGSIRDLLGTVNQLDAIARLQQRPIDAKLCAQYLKGDIEVPKPEIKVITRIVSQEFGVNISEIRSAARDRKLVLARQCAMYLSREIAEKPLQEIARYFGGRNHSTVIHSCRRFEQRLSDDAALGKELKTILHRLGLPSDSVLITC
ncbi:Chromosomal replication initiator protein DnaA [Polystyrenella longa]|uniref:Chromosomal replication initiator protein DnaA n=1 Tax=Polystyrenella longa TaxID=2528007 RepID=A0A518CGE9_9PLAN|nr:DnaA/Hda family protein [Polystyrenella longa]QDU78300.1 Chromosomal replication initiator protein DnaA [Polystyrenella longa]